MTPPNPGLPDDVDLTGPIDWKAAQVATNPPEQINVAISLQLTAATAIRLFEAAEQAGMTPDQFAIHLIEAGLNDPTRSD